MGLDELFGLAGKVALVTGGAAGIGRGIARALAVAGATVAVADLDERGAEDVARTLGGRAIGLRADVSDEGAVQGLVDSVCDRLGALDVLVNNAGIYPATPISETTVAEWDRVMAVNLRGPMLCTREAARVMRAQGSGGAIVNLSSMAGFHPCFPGMAQYCASKGGVVMLTRSAALELAPDGIRVNAVCPGGVETEGTRENLESGLRDVLTPRIPLGRVAVPEDIAGAVVFLAGPAARYVTGTTLVVDGGYLIS